MSLLLPYRALTAATLAASLALCSLAEAGKATIEAGQGGTAEIEYAQGLLRVGSSSAQGYMLIRDNIMYVVSLEGGSPMVFNASSMMKGMAQGATQMAPSALSNEFVSLQDTGRDETHAGMKGDVYNFTFKEDDGGKQTEEVVLSSDERAIEFRNALFSMSIIAEELAGKEAIAQRKDLQQRMESMNVGVLRYGNELKITAISADPVPASRFALPAQPLDIQGLGNLMEALKKQQ